MQNGPKFLVAATFEKANTYVFAEYAIHNSKVGGSIPPPATNVFKDLRRARRACRFSLSRSCHVKLDRWEPFRLLSHVSHRHPNVRPTEDRRQRKSICAGVTHAPRSGVAKIVKAQGGSQGSMAVLLKC